VALEWDARTLRVAHASWRKKRVRVDKVLSAEIPSDIDRHDAEQMGHYIRRILHEQGIHTRRAVVDIARDQAILSTLTLPVGAPEDLPGMVEFQIAKDLPFAASDAAIDFAMPPDASDGDLVPIAVAAVRHEFVEHYKAICHAAGFRLERIGLRPFANKIAVCEMLKGALPEHVLFIDVGPTLMEVDVISPSSLAFSRAASVIVPKSLSKTPGLRLLAPGTDGDVGGVGDVSDSASDSSGVVPVEPSILSTDSVVRELLLEVTRSVEAYRTSDPGASITHAVVAGDLGVEEALQEAIQSRFGFSVDLYNPASTFGWTPDEGAGASGFPAVLGLILGEEVEERLHFDFLHPKQTVTQAQVQLRKAPRRLAWVAFIIVAAGVLYWAQFSPGRREVRNLERQIANLEEGRRDKEALIRLVQQISDFDDRQEIWVDNLFDLVDALPTNETLVLERLDMINKERQFTVKTRTKAHEDGVRIREAVERYTREGAAKPRFDAWLASRGDGQRGDKYPYTQDLHVRLLKDGWKPSSVDEVTDDASDAKTGDAPAGKTDDASGKTTGGSAGNTAKYEPKA